MKNILTSAYLLFALNGWAYQPPDSTSVDTLDFDHAVEDAEEIGADDSVLVTSGIHIYEGMDTINIHPDKIGKPFQPNDSILVCLADGYCGYYHPYNGYVTSDFGFRKGRPHYGVDVKLQIGDSVVSAFEGKVRIAKRSKSYGNVIVVRHSNGLETLYAHLSKFLVSVGDPVDAGQPIGLGGNTGRSSGSHLHFEVRYKGQPINPNDLISFTDKKILKDTVVLSNKTFDHIDLFKKQREAYLKKRGRYYTVRKGDTLSSIARKYKTSAKKIAKLNGIKTTTPLRIGKRLKVI